jgi:hypothetical protein
MFDNQSQDGSVGRNKRRAPNIGTSRIQNERQLWKEKAFIKSQELTISSPGCSSRAARKSLPKLYENDPLPGLRVLLVTLMVGEVAVVPDVPSALSWYSRRDNTASWYGSDTYE